MRGSMLLTRRAASQARRPPAATRPSFLSRACPLHPSSIGGCEEDSDVAVDTCCLTSRVAWARHKDDDVSINDVRRGTSAAAAGQRRASSGNISTITR